jgi:hypothetical protein
MKKLIMILSIAVTVVSCTKQSLPANTTSTSSSSQSGVEEKVTTVPAAVTAAFVAKFGNIAVQQWGLRNDGTYRAHFTKNAVAWEATFTAAGVLVKSEAA